MMSWVCICLQRFSMPGFSPNAWSSDNGEVIQISVAPAAAKIPLKLLPHFSPRSRQLGYGNAENVELFRQTMMQTQSSELRKAVLWQRG